MILRSLRYALVSGALLAAGCQTYETRPVSLPVTTAMDGVWASTDGVFVANFERGGFTSRFTATNEVLAQGSYTVAGTMVTMQWISVATQQRRSAACTINTPDSVTCNQDGGGHFELGRTGAAGAIEPAPAPAPAPLPAPAPAPLPAPAPAPLPAPAPAPAPAPPLAPDPATGQ